MTTLRADDYETSNDLSPFRRGAKVTTMAEDEAFSGNLQFEDTKDSPFLDGYTDTATRTDVEAALGKQIKEVDLEEAEPLRWTGTPDQVTFRDRVLQAHLDASRKRKGAPIADLTAADLAPVQGTPVRMRKDAAQAADRLLSAARAALAEAQRVGHPDAVKTLGITASSGYRSREHQERLWKGYFDGTKRKPKGYYDETAPARARLPGGPHGDSAIDYMLRVFRIPDRVAAPGYSNHQAGRAIDLAQKRVEGQPVFNTTSRRWVSKWESTWLFEWLLANAGSAAFEHYLKEPWHWTYRPAGSSELFGQERSTQVGQLRPAEVYESEEFDEVGTFDELYTEDEFDEERPTSTAHHAVTAPRVTARPMAELEVEQVGQLRPAEVYESEEFDEVGTFDELYTEDEFDEERPTSTAHHAVTAPRVTARPMAELEVEQVGQLRPAEVYELEEFDEVGTFDELYTEDEFDEERPTSTAHHAVTAPRVTARPMAEHEDDGAPNTPQSGIPPIAQRADPSYLREAPHGDWDRVYEAIERVRLQVSNTTPTPEDWLQPDFECTQCRSRRNLLEQERLDGARRRIIVRPRLSLFLGKTRVPSERNHFEFQALGVAKKTGAIGRPDTTNCRIKVGATPYASGRDIIDSIRSAYTCLGNKPIEVVHIVGHSGPSGIFGGTAGTIGLYRDTFPLDAASSAGGARHISEIPTDALSNDVIFVLHGCNQAKENENFARSLFEHLAASLTNPRVYGHWNHGCAGRDNSWKLYSPRYPNGGRARPAYSDPGGCKPRK